MEVELESRFHVRVYIGLRMDYKNGPLHCLRSLSFTNLFEDLRKSVLKLNVELSTIEVYKSTSPL